MLLRRHRPGAPVWRRRSAIVGGAILVGLAAIAFAKVADRASTWFDAATALYWWLPLPLTPAGFVLITWITNRLAPAARGSGIPQIIAAKRDPAAATADLASGRTATVKAVLTATWAQAIG